jgi:hypothetical protein
VRLYGKDRTSYRSRLRPWQAYEVDHLAKDFRGLSLISIVLQEIGNANGM